MDVSDKAEGVCILVCRRIVFIFADVAYAVFYRLDAKRKVVSDGQKKIDNEMRETLYVVIEA